jgi:protein-cysteine N-palmitoyltransferase HHAT
MWMKFLIIWRFFRIVSIVDGIRPPENLEPRSCVILFYSVREFWKNWHSSMNLWIIRYMYIPLGGRKNILFTSWFIFTFVAVWHDLWLRWIIWAYLNCIFIMLETVVEALFNKYVYDHLKNLYFREFIVAFLIGLIFF